MNFIKLMVAGLVLTAFATASAAQGWPDRPVRMIVPTPAGSAPDVVARVLAEKLTSQWGHAVIVDNRPGAGGINAMSSFVRSPPDGYTLGFIHSGVIALTPHLFRNPQFSFDTDVATIGTIVSGSMVVAVNPKLGINSFPDLIRAAKSNPSKLVFAVPLLNSVPHVTGELLFRTAGIQLQSVPYNGAAAAITAMLSGTGADVLIDSPAPMLDHLKSGRIKPVAVTSPKRMAGLENVPAVAETLPGFQAFGWFALFAPARTPRTLIERINRDLSRAIQQPDFVRRVTELGLEPLPGSVAQSNAFIDAERQRWGAVIRDMGVKPE